jgi:hypothetical protein
VSTPRSRDASRMVLRRQAARSTHIYWTDARVSIEPRHGFIEITQCQLHLFSRAVVRRN